MKVGAALKKNVSMLTFQRKPGVLAELASNNFRNWDLGYLSESSHEIISSEKGCDLVRPVFVYTSSVYLH